MMAEIHGDKPRQRPRDYMPVGITWVHASARRESPGSENTEAHISTLEIQIHSQTGVLDEVAKIVDEGRWVKIGYVELFKAFGTSKKQSFGSHNESAENKRAGKVHHGPAEMPVAVPQGSVPGPTPFLTIISDPVSSVCNSCCLFADNNKAASANLKADKKTD